MAKQIINRMKLGVFVTFSLVLFIIAVYYVGDRQNMFSNSITLKAIFRNVNGLQKGNNVRFSGINVGTVTAIEIISDTAVMVRMNVAESAGKHIRKDAIATVTSDGLVGNMIVSIIPTVNQAHFVKSGDLIPTYSRIAAGDMLNTLNVTNENAALLTADLLKITNGILEKKGTLGVLLYDSSLANDIKLTLNNLKQSSVALNRATHKINSTINLIQNPDGLFYSLTSDSTLSNQLYLTMDNLQSTSQQITKMSEKLNTIIKDAQQENGAIKTLVYDTTLVHDLKQSMENINQGTEKFNENMEAMKHNFLTRRYFKKLEKQKEKDQ